MRSATTGTLFVLIMALTTFAVIVVWPSYPQRYLPGDFWPEGRGFNLFGVERDTMRLGLDLRGGSYLLLEAQPPDDYEGNLDEAVETIRDVIENRVNAFGVSESEVQTVSGSRISVQVPGLEIEEAERLIGRTAQLRFMVFNEQSQVVPATGVINGVTVEMTGEHIRGNTLAARDAIGLSARVDFETTGTGEQLMRQITSRLIGQPAPFNSLIILLDDEVISQAQVTGVIEDQGSISNMESFEAAQELSRQLNAGALPVPLAIIQSSEVSATLGDQSVVDTVRAGQIGLIAVALFMILLYRLPGLLAAFALVVYTALVLLVFKLWPVTLTLSGIAAFVLSVGMAVDANILIFERTKEELRRGRTLNSAIDIGFSRAWSSIRDSNVATLITCVILYWFGEQFGAAPVKGFALTLAIGVGISMFSAITVTRTFLKMLVGTSLAKRPWLFNASEQRARTRDAAGTAPATSRLMIDFIKHRWIFLSASFALMAAALVILAIPPRLVPGIEFTSGSSFTLEFTQNVTSAELREVLEEKNHPEARIQETGDNTFLVRTDVLEGSPPLQAGDAGPLPAGELDTIEAALQERFGDFERRDFATVSGSVSSEIATYAFLAVLASALAIFGYLAFAFRRIPSAWKYGACAVVALAHDALIVLGLFSLLGKINGTEVDTAFITAVLTIIGFSVHDTIVVFDRVRETLSHDPFIPFGEAVNASLTETLPRSLNTSLTVVFTVLALLLMGGETIENFLLVLLVGVVAGTYSSIGLAAQLLVAWQEGDFPRAWRRVFGGGRGSSSETPAAARSAS